MALQSQPPALSGRSRQRAGLGYALLTYFMWGVFPIYFHSLEPASVWEILGARIALTLVFCVILLSIRRDWGWLRQLRNRRILSIMVAAGFAVALNWGLYISAVAANRVAEGALGYFINPLVTVALGVVVLGERLRPLQWLAVVVGGVAVAYLTWDYGHMPWLSLALAFSFATYGLLKNRVGGTIGAVQSVTVESAALLPVAAVLLIWVGLSGHSTFLGHGLFHGVLLASAGIVTALPLLTFGAAAGRVPLSTMGLLQYVTPVGQLLVAVFIYHEPISPSRWVGFAIVWLALLIMSFDQVTHFRVGREQAAAADAH